MRVVFDGVGKSYPDGTVALADLGFAVPVGEFCVVLGPSGAGKSTLLRTVNGLAEPTTGRVLVDGVPVTRRTLARLRPGIGMIHQSFDLVGRASVATNVLSGALPAISTPRALLGLFAEPHQRRAMALIAEVGLEERHLGRRVSELSGGQQQRVGIARAFMLDPGIVLADEPVASLDPRISADILGLLRREAKARGTTVLCSLHQIDLARAFADRIVALKAGRLLFDGPPAALTAELLRNLYDVQDAGTSPAANSGRCRVDA